MFSFDVTQKTKNDVFVHGAVFDALVVGGGPAGLNAALYLVRKGKKVGVITKEIGGQLHNTSEVDNYLGFTHILGKDLSDTFLTHANHLEIPILNEVSVQNIQKVNKDFEVHISNGMILHSKTLLYATGGSPRKLDVKGEMIYANKGVSYCTTCDAPFFKGKHVIVAGGGNSAAEAVIDLVPWASKITVVHRSQWRADDVLLKKLTSIENLTIHLETQILEVLGQDTMTGLKVLDKKTNETFDIEAEGLFIEIGTIPNVSLIRHLVQTTSSGEVIVNDMQETSCEGLYAAGDVTNQPFKQIIIATAEGAKAALAMNQYLNQ